MDAAGSISFGIWGRPWSFKASSAINEIVVHHGNNIKSISFGDADGNHSVTFGGDNPNDVGEKKTVRDNCYFLHIKFMIVLASPVCSFSKHG